MVATRRHVTQGKSGKYEIGDKVELVRTEGIDVGILLSKEEEEDGRSEGVTHWVVSVDGSSEEEVISEKMLGRVLDDTEQSDGSTFEKSPKDQIPVKKASNAKVKVVSKRKKPDRHSITTRSGEDSEFSGGMAFETRQVPKPKKKSGDETVIEVKMLTGTLFIYRGENHRVEFARTV